MAIIGSDILKAKEILDKNGLVGIPTETVYGLAGNALESSAVAMIFKVKNRPSFDPLIIHTDSLDKVRDLVKHIPDKLNTLMKHFSPGPLSLLLPKKAIIPDLVTSGLENVAIRIPKHPKALALLENLDYPLAAPSANPFGYISPTSPHHVDKQLGNRIEYILDGGNCEVGLESTIVGFEANEICIYRKGGLAIEEIEQLIGKVKIKEHSNSNPAAPGMLKSHYAPNKIVKLDGPGRSRENNYGFLGFDAYIENVAQENQFILSPTGDLVEAAQNLFKGLRYLDQLSISTVYLQLVPEVGLGRAINDRIRRAAAEV